MQWNTFFVLFTLYSDVYIPLHSVSTEPDWSFHAQIKEMQCSDKRASECAVNDLIRR